MIVRPVLSGMLVFVLVRIACVGMLVRMLMLMFMAVDMGVLVSVRDLVVGVLMGMSMSVLMLVAMNVLAFHRIPLRLLVWRTASLDKVNLSAIRGKIIIANDIRKYR
jgi:hypothetical protein